MFEGVVCAFTVVPDPLMAVEATEHTAYHLVFFAEDSQAGLSARAFVKSLRMVGSEVPVILLKDGGGSEESAAQVVQNDHEDPSLLQRSADTEAIFATVLRKPFTKRDLCDAIRSTLFPNFHRVGGELNSLTSEDDYRMGEDEMST